MIRSAVPPPPPVEAQPLIQRLLPNNKAMKMIANARICPSRSGGTGLLASR
jgi:hypothetical protein